MGGQGLCACAPEPSLLQPHCAAACSRLGSARCPAACAARCWALPTDETRAVGQSQDCSCQRTLDQLPYSGPLRCTASASQRQLGESARPCALHTWRCSLCRSSLRAGLATLGWRARLQPVVSVASCRQRHAWILPMSSRQLVRQVACVLWQLLQVCRRPSCALAAAIFVWPVHLHSCRTEEIPWSVWWMPLIMLTRGSASHKMCSPVTEHSPGQAGQAGASRDFSAV